ncbi:YycH family protein [Carnobacterium maltaromaticum]|uniref:YycH family regulatory protein n=1 Tax=Carnobacterium maltaromaticum TaxID=2751 RepID=UPI000704F555|nr:two-component system activity regulator YycH [Carnobacterium maltaromaticum]KRN73071.1 regulator of WalKR [Carnobacterium maltaromaticum]MBC9808848.1 regulator of WalKR [Carnobacterium maltaromaticum]CRH17239.1 YycH family protein [Carnobacterium maltaromaticum]
MKIRYFVRIALVFLVALSLVLTWAIWTMPNKIENSNDSNSKKTGINSTLQENEIFSANRVVFHTDNNPKLASNPDLMARLDKEFYEWKFSNIKDAKTYNDEDYTSKLGEGNSLEFIYPTARPFSTLTKSFSKLASNYRNQTFQRIVIPLNESGEIHFFDDNSRTVYSAEIEGFNKSTLSDVLTSNEKYFVDVSIQKLATRFVYLPKEEVELSSPSYIAELKPSLEIRNRLFEDLSEITNSTTADKRFEQYYDNVSKVTVDKETNILTYNRSSTSVKLDLQDVLKYSISELKDFEVWPGKIRFFQYNNTKQQVVYRRYIEGFPVFGRGGMENDFGGTYLTIAKDGVLSRMQMSLVIAQTPVFDEMAEKRLLNGSELIAHLDSIGYPINTIDDIELGYCWTKNLGSDGLESEESGANTIVDFEPSWYIFTNGIWYNIDELSDNQDGEAK